ncbi:MAG: GAF domain-containing protein [Anaerolineales bacterium]|nr:GAF domain-containing protein [Anaerolineales bacterium]
MFNSIFRTKVSQPVRTSHLGKFWNLLTEANASITDFGERRSARLAASFLLVIAAFDLIGGFARAARMGLIVGFSGPIGISLIPLLLAYGLVKTKWYRAGIFIFALGFNSLAYVSMILEGRQANFGNLIFIYIPLGLILVSALVSAWATFLLLGLNVCALWITTSFVISYQPDGLVVLIGLMSTTGLVLIVLSNFQKSLEQSRLDELKQINKELDSARIDLEQRVAARTKDLATVAEVGTATATILESKQLLQEVVNLTKERFNLYHSHIYLLDETGENLVLTAGAGEPGRIMVAKGHSIPMDREQSLVARAARDRKGVTVNDVTQAPDFLPNPLLPETRSELAVPMIVGSRVIGVFDIQSEQIGRFTDADVNVQTTLAAQLAASIQNVRTYEQSKAQAELESLVNTISQKIQRTTTVEDTLQTAIREIGLALGASRVSANIGASIRYDSDEAKNN